MSTSETIQLLYKSSIKKHASHHVKLHALRFSCSTATERNKNPTTPSGDADIQESMHNESTGFAQSRSLLEGEPESTSISKIDQAALEMISNHVVTLSLVNAES